jgi:hypothetical protein
VPAETIARVRIAPLRDREGIGQTGPLSVALFVRGTTASPQPVTVGLPFPRGGLQDTGSLSLAGADGRPIRLQAEPLARWPDGSVKWLLLDFVCPAGGPAVGRWTLHREAGVNGRGGPGTLSVEESAAGLAGGSMRSE